MKMNRRPQSPTSEPSTSKRPKMTDEASPSHQENEDINIVTGTSDYYRIVESDAFVDKTSHIPSFVFPKQTEKTETFLIAAPYLSGKSTNMDMLQTFLQIEVDDAGNPKNNAAKDQTGHWVEGKNSTKAFQLFKKLKIYECRHKPKHSDDECMLGKCSHRNFFYEHLGQHPVIFLSLKDLECDSESFKDGRWNSENIFHYTLRDSLNAAFNLHPYLENELTSRLREKDRAMCSKYVSDEKLSESEVKSGLATLVDFLYKQFDRKVFMLLEGYDVRISRLLERADTTEDHLTNVMGALGSLVSTVLKDNKKVRGGVVNASLELTGSLSTYANNITSCTLENARFADYCGFSESELEKLFQQPKFNKVNQLEIKELCNGYRGIGTDIEIYHTYSVIMYLTRWADSRKWNEKSSTKVGFKFLVSRGVTQLQRIFSIEDIGNRIQDLLHDISVEVDTIPGKMTPGELYNLKEMLNRQITEVTTEHIALFFHYLKHRGYLNATKANASSVTLTIPNLEVKEVFARKLFFSGFFKNKFGAQSEEYVRALTSLNGNDESTFKVLVESIIKMFSSKRPLRHELKDVLDYFAFQSRVFNGVICKRIVEKGSKSRCDLVIIRPDGTRIFIEIASGGQNAEEALNQIFTSGYRTRLRDKSCKGQKLYVGLYYDYDSGNAEICAYATDGETVTTNLGVNDKHNLIRV